MTICPTNDSCQLDICTSESIEEVGRSHIGDTCGQCGHVFRCDGEVAGWLKTTEPPLPTCSVECAEVYRREITLPALKLAL